MNATTKFIVFAAPSGAGKSTLVRHLLEQSDLPLMFSISATSRAPRPGEEHGKHYYFFDTKAFKQIIKNKEFLEYEEVYSDLFYGTLKQEIDRIGDLGKHVIFDIDVVGALNIKQKFPERTLTVFVKPPSINELKIRLKKRRTESDDKINMRIAKAGAEMATAPQFDVVIENNDLDKAKAEACQIVKEFLER
ncbi:MAG: guanylate kinase [Flavobacteriaceae bacterium]|nr:guanylate kinase [Flavobacteriaceae bacterium]